MTESAFGTEQLTEEDRGYGGSRFREVVDALLANPYQRVWGGEGEAALPVHEVTLGSVLRGGSFRSGNITCFDRPRREPLIPAPTCVGALNAKGFGASCTRTAYA
jgi:hypothetical protein